MMMKARVAPSKPVHTFFLLVMIPILLLMIHDTSAWTAHSIMSTSRPILHKKDDLLYLSAAQEDKETGRAISESTIDFDSLNEMDCFIYSTNTGSDDKEQQRQQPKLELGVVEEKKLQPICAWTMEEAFDDYIEFVVDEEDRDSVNEKDVTIHSLIPDDALSFGSRQVGGGMGPGNPHGEESELLYYIRKDALDGLEATVKPELEIFW